MRVKNKERYENCKKIKKSVSYIFLFIFLMLLTGIITAVGPSYTCCTKTNSTVEEDQFPLFTYNYSNISNDPENDTMYWEIIEINSTLHPYNKDLDFYTWFDLNLTTGILTVNSTEDNHTGRFNLSIEVFEYEPDRAGQTDVFYYMINATNDAPEFSNVSSSYNVSQSQVFLEYINATDEPSEEHYPLYFNLTFVNCSLAVWSDRGNCSLLDIVTVNDSYGMMNLTPTLNDVGSYEANLSVMDFGENYTCISDYCEPNYSQNKTTYYSGLIVFNVLSELSIDATDCNNAIFQENTSNQCIINVTTRGESDVVNLSSLALLRNYEGGNVTNESWFYADNKTNSSGNIINVYINVTPGKTEVGNWTINFTAYDVSYSESLTEQINISVNRTYNDVPELEEIQDLNASIDYLTKINLTCYDDDMLIPDKNASFGFNETINFTAVILNQSNLSQELDLNDFQLVIFEMPVPGTNRSTARMEFKPNSSDVGDYTINVSAVDRDGSIDVKMFNLTVFSNEAPKWNLNTDTFVINEDDSFYINFSENVTDPDGDDFNFTYSINNDFSSFSLTEDEGIVNFTALDVDVGEHLVSINVSDGYLINETTLNFTIYNIDDNPVIETPLTVVNATVAANSNISAIENNVTTIYLYVEDDDYKIKQKDFYEENISINYTITGNNTNLFQFVKNPNFPPPDGNKAQFYAIFTPNDSDIGLYEVYVNITDNNGFNDSLQFNITISDYNFYPVLMELENKSLLVNDSLYYRINATDVEDGSSNETGNYNLTFDYGFISGDDFINDNESIFNTTTGELNMSFNDSHSGYHEINISVNDTYGNINSEIFSISVYDYPVINSPDVSYVFNLAENNSYNLTFNANHTVGDNLSYNFYIDRNGARTLRYSANYYGNGSDFIWEYSPNFSEETHGVTNLTLVVYSSNANISNISKYNDSRTWNFTINHTDSPLSFIDNIDDRSGSSPQQINLSNHFLDSDASDSVYNQTVGFTYTLINSSGGTISVEIVNWTNGTLPGITFSASQDGSGIYSVTGQEYNISNSSHIIRNVTSNNFTISLEAEDPDPDPEPDTGGGGGGSGTIPRPVAFKLIAPGHIKGYSDKEIKIPLMIQSKSTRSFSGISLNSSLYSNGSLFKDVRSYFDVDYIDRLAVGESKNVTLTLYFGENRSGSFKVVINASSRVPFYTDWAEIVLDLSPSGAGAGDTSRLILFTEEFLVENPECAEITEILNEAKEYYQQGDYDRAREKAEEAINACKRSISQKSLFKERLKGPFLISFYLLIAIVLSVLLGVSYYYFKRLKFGKIKKSVIAKSSDEKIVEGVH
ncbi:hypothetical protein GF386_02235 [Candidatus Pacearchaeota archaeon]|nr:hypothetical protein [Candidatus Pacearchaeota archaeon]